MKRSIGIDINRDKISIVQLCFYGGKFSLERVSVREISESGFVEEKSTAHIKSLINSMLTEEDFDISAKVTVTALSENVFFQHFRTDLSVNEDVQHLIKYELEDDFPIPFDELIAGVCGGRELKGNYREYLICATNRSELRNQVQTIKEAHLKCSAITPDVCALYAAASVSNDLNGDAPTAIFLADNSRVILAISVKGSLVCARHFDSQNGAEDDVSLTVTQRLTREVEMSLRSIFGLNGDVRLKILMSASSNEFLNDISSRLSESINCEIMVLDPFTKIACSKQHNPNTDILIATGLALIGTKEIPEFLNFLSIDEEKSDKAAETKRGLIIAGALLLAIGILLVVRLFYERHNLENQHELIKKQIREVFVQTLPEEKKIVNELAQMNEKLEAVQTEYAAIAAGMSDRVLPLKIMQAVSEKITPDQNIRINDISMSPALVRLAGLAPSFESVDDLMSVLRQVSEFNSIEVPSIDIEPQSSGVRFTLSITMVSK